MFFNNLLNYDFESHHFKTALHGVQWLTFTIDVKSPERELPESQTQFYSIQCYCFDFGITIGDETLPTLVCQFSRAAITKYPWLDDLSDRKLFPHHSGSLRPRCRQSWFLLRSFSLACRWRPSPWVFTWSFLCVCVLIYSTYKDTVSYWIMINDPYDLILP